MKRISLLIFLAVLTTVLSAQSLLDNPDHKKSLEYKTLYQKAMDSGDYDKALEYADLAADHARKSEEYVSTMVVRFRANQALQRLKSRIAEVKRMGADKTHATEFSLAGEAYSQAMDLFKQAEYQGSLDQSNSALDLLAGITRPQKGNLPAKYKVRLIPGDRDCLWKIAGYSFVYNDPTLWKLLYNANKSEMPDPENPNLILPGMLLSIPTRENENRSGIWDSSAVD